MTQRETDHPIPVDPSTPEREAVEDSLWMKAVVAENAQNDAEDAGAPLTKLLELGKVASATRNAYAAAVRARALADVAGWVDDVRGTMPGIGKRPDEVSNDAFYETRGMERACGALLAKLREAK